MHSLSSRLLLSLTAMLVVFFGVTIAALDKAFKYTAEKAMRDRLEVQVIALLADTEPIGDGELGLPGELHETRLAHPGSGLYAQILAVGGAEVWRSPSLVGDDIPSLGDLGPGVQQFERLTTRLGRDIYRLKMGVDWVFEDDASRRYVFSVAEDLASFYGQLARFRRALFGWFASLAALLLGTQALILRYALKPLRLAEGEVQAIESGQRELLSDEYPKELVGLTANMNALITTERARLKRYRDTLGNLAHSLRTSLTILRQMLDSGRPIQVDVVEEQVKQMQQIVEHQLRRASVVGSGGIGARGVVVAPVVEKIRKSLDKVWAGQGRRCDVEINDAVFYGDEGDLMEIIGNLLDNAYKWGRRVRLSACPIVEDDRRPGLNITVEDDGPGIDPELRERVFDRGVHLDEQHAGQGIGLAIVREVAQLYGATVSMGSATLGGAEVTVAFPPK